MKNKNLKDLEAEEMIKQIASEATEKFINSIKSSDEDNGTFRVKMTDETVDRMGEIIKIDGWDFKNFMNNPVVLWGHSHSSLPLGAITKIESTDDGVFADGIFASEDANPMAQQVRKLYDLGMLKAVSVGFIEKERDGNTITKAELIELSFVTVPANPEALSTLMANNISVNELATKGLLDFDIKTTTKETEEDEEEDASNSEDKKEEEEKKEESVVDEKPEEKEEGEKTISDVYSLVKSIDERLVALESSAKDLEGNENESEDEEESEEDNESKTEEEKTFDKFSKGKKLLQDAATCLSDVLAEVRLAKKATDEKK